jgi:hypothetical protein
VLPLLVNAVSKNNARLDRLSIAVGDGVNKGVRAEAYLSGYMGVGEEWKLARPQPRGLLLECHPVGDNRATFKFGQ